MTSALQDRESPLSKWLTTDFPNTIGMREYARQVCGSILVPPTGNVDRPALGAAFDMLATIALRPEEALALLDIEVSRIWTPAHARLAGNLSEIVLQTLGDGDEEGVALYKCTWVLGLLVNSMRSAQAYLRSGITEVLRTATSSRELEEGLDDLITAEGLRQLRELHEIAKDELYPRLRGPIHVHADISQGGAQAEADIIAGGLLLDLKTSAGTQQSSGDYRLLPSARDIHQMIAYSYLATMPERKDEYGRIAAVGFYFARYGALVAWPAEIFMTEAMA